MKYKVKLIVGFRRDQEHSIPADEAHKAYHLFFNPDTRTIFSNGLAIKGDQIQEIVPDYQGTMGWNASHQLNDDDWNELRANGVSGNFQRILSASKEIAQRGDPTELNIPLTTLLSKYPKLAPQEERQGSMKRIGD